MGNTKYLLCVYIASDSILCGAFLSKGSYFSPYIKSLYKVSARNRERYAYKNNTRGYKPLKRYKI